MLCTIKYASNVLCVTSGSLAISRGKRIMILKLSKMYKAFFLYFALSQIVTEAEAEIIFKNQFRKIINLKIIV